MSARREILLAALVFLLAAVAFAPDAALGHGVFWHHDFRHHHYPWRVWAAGEWAKGVVPWWSSGAANGFPLLAEGEGGFLYPPTMLAFLLLPPGLALNWAVLGHYAWAALGMFVFLRSDTKADGKVDRGVSFVAALTGGLAWGWSGFLVSHAMYLGMLNGLAWLGWAMWGVRARRWPWVALAVGMMGLAGHPQAAAFGGLGLAIYALATLPFAGLVRFAAAVAVGGLVASPQILASLELSRFSMRDGGVADLFANIGKLPPQEILNGVLPKLFGADRPADIAETYYHRGSGYWGSGENYWEMCWYLGIPVVVLALAGARRNKAWAIAAGVALLVMLGGPLWALVRHLPGFAFFRFPVRFGMWVTFAVAVLAARGVDRLRTDAGIAGRGRTIAMAAWALGVALVGGGLAIRAAEGPVRAALTHHYEAKAELPPPPADVPPLQLAALPGADVTPAAEIPAKVDAVFHQLWITTSLLSPRVWTPVGLLLLTAFAWRRPKLLPAVVFLDLWLFGYDFHPTVPVADTQHRPGWLAVGMTEPGGYRTTVLDRRGDPGLDTELGTASLGLLWGTSDVLIPSPLLMLRNDALLALTGLDVGDKGPEKVKRYEAHRDIANRMAVKWIASTHPMAHLGDMTTLVSGDIHVTQDDRALPRARVVRCAEAATSAEDAFAKVKAADPRETVVVEGGLPAGCAGTSDGEGGATIAAYGEQEVVLRASGPGTLVLADSWYPEWTATVDGAPVEIGRADMIYRAVALPEGSHEVRFRFEPGLPGTLLPVAGAALLLCGILAVGPSVGRRAPRPA